MKGRTRTILALAIFSTPGLLGAVLGWIVSAGDPPFFRAVATMLGAAVGFAIAQFVAIVVRAFTPPRTVEEGDWREQSRRIEERTKRNFQWVAKWAWALAIPLALVVVVISFAAGGGIWQALLGALITFIVFWGTIRLAAIDGVKMLFLPKRPARSSSPPDPSQ